jgi:hypothetical protein
MIRRFVSFLVVIASGCAVDSPSPAPDPSPSPPDLSASVRISWGGQDVTSTDPEDSRVPRTLTGPVKPCPNVVGDDVVQVEIEVIIGTGIVYVGDATPDCALGNTTLPVPAGSGTYRLDVVTAWGYSWLASNNTPITTVAGQTTDGGTVNLNNEIPTSGGGGDGDGDGDGW